MVVYFDLILAKKIRQRTAAFEIIWVSRRDGFLFHSVETVRTAVLKKVSGGALLKFQLTKHFTTIVSW